MAAIGGVSEAAAHANCNAINDGALNVELEAPASITRQAALQAGDIVTFSFEAAPGPFGTLTLLQGAAAPRSLLVGPTGTSVSFRAARGGEFGFEFSKEGVDAAAFTASCVPAASARRARTPAADPAALRRADALIEIWSKAQDLEAEEFAGFMLDAAPKPQPPVPKTAPPWVTAPRSQNDSALTQAAGIDMKMQWRGERYRIGPDGLEIDHTASGVDATLNYKPLPGIMVGALAQFDQPSESLTASPHSLSDQGWMVGPATNVKLAPGLTLDARAAWGVAESAADDLAARMTSVPRRAISARLANTQSFGPWRLTPSISVNHFQESSAAAAAPLPETALPYAATSGRVDVGPELAYRIDLDKSVFIEPKAAIGSFWGIDSLSRLAPGTAGHNDMRLKAQAGVTIGATGGTKLQAAGGVEEGEPGAENVWSGRLQLSVPMP